MSVKKTPIDLIEKENSKKEKPAQIPENPLGRIAICMSGGGYRAAVFQLGVLSYLDKLEFGDKRMLDNVKAISTVSGGTITGVMYSMLLKRGKAFKEIYHTLIDWLMTTDLVKAGLEKVSNNGQWDFEHKTINLVNAFAELYDKTLTQGGTLEIFKDIEKTEHLEFVCFNSTEFKTGLRFRFQMAKGQDYVGAGGINIKKEVYKSIKLSDIIAASSAFSGGFEPISMPNDFIDLDENQVKYFESHSGYKGKPIGLMDGGIFDNQGISAIEDYQDNEGIEDFDLILISDVASPYMNAFEFSEESSSQFKDKTLSEIRDRWIVNREYLVVGMWTLLILGIVFTLSSNFENSTFLGVGIVLTLFGILLATCYYFISSTVKKWLAEGRGYIKKVIPEFYLASLKSLGIEEIKIGRLERLLLDRINSLKILLPTIFLKQVRRLHYNRIYENDNYIYRRLTCLVKELTKIDFKKKVEEDYSEVSERLKEFSGETFEKIMGEKLIEYTEEAASFGTTLWFTDRDKLNRMLESLLISGQSTCCQNILIYLDKLIHTEDNGFSLLSTDIQKKYKDAHKIALEDWSEFKEDPEFLHEILYPKKQRNFV